MMQEAALGEVQQVKSNMAEVRLFDKRGVEQKNSILSPVGSVGGPMCSHRFSN